MAKYVISLRPGTTSSRAILFDHNGGRLPVSNNKEFRPDLFPLRDWSSMIRGVLVDQLRWRRAAMRKVGASPLMSQLRYYESA